jgi:hypothetical protein
MTNTELLASTLRENTILLLAWQMCEQDVHAESRCELCNDASVFVSTESLDWSCVTARVRHVPSTRFLVVVNDDIPFAETVGAALRLVGAPTM